MVCASVREDNPRALASGLSPVHTHSHTITFYCTRMHMHLVHGEIFVVEHLVINEKGALSTRTDHAITVTHMYPLKLQ